jgi:hypothetical protein
VRETETNNGQGGWDETYSDKANTSCSGAGAAKRKQRKYSGNAFHKIVSRHNAPGERSIEECRERITMIGELHNAPGMQFGSNSCVTEKTVARILTLTLYSPTEVEKKVEKK